MLLARFDLRVALGFRPTGGGTFHAPQPSCIAVVRLVPFRALAPFAIHTVCVLAHIVKVTIPCGLSRRYSLIGLLKK